MLKGILLIFIVFQTLACQASPIHPEFKSSSHLVVSSQPSKGSVGNSSESLALHNEPFARSMDFASDYRPASQWIWQGPGQVQVPILMYHNVADHHAGERYFTSLADFESQMAWLANEDFTTIPISSLLNSISHGAEMPPKPLIITFDDGWKNIFQNAFPIRHEHGFTGTAYLVTNCVGGETTMDWDEISTLVDAGWEIGSHSSTHPNLKEHHELLERELRHSRFQLQQHLDIDILTFAYPFGASDSTVANAVFQAGYMGAVGLGNSYVHNKHSLFYLSRIEVQGTMSLEDFVALLPTDTPNN